MGKKFKILKKEKNNNMSLVVSVIHYTCFMFSLCISVKNLMAPLLFLHSEDDNIVPFHMGQEVISMRTLCSENVPVE